MRIAIVDIDYVGLSNAVLFKTETDVIVGNHMTGDISAKVAEIYSRDLLERDANSPPQQ